MQSLKIKDIRLNIPNQSKTYKKINKCKENLRAKDYDKDRDRGRERY